MSDPGYMQGEEGNPLAEGLAHGGRGAAEAAAVLMMAMQVLARIREKQANARVEGDQAETQRRQDELRADHARARAQWAPALEPDFASATDRDALGAWVAAQPWRQHDRSAEEASVRAEGRLEQLHPDLMAQYRELQQLDGFRENTVWGMHESIKAVSSDLWSRPLLENTWDEMDVDATLRAWDAARPWATDGGTLAAQSMHIAEERLRELRPVAMETFDERLALGDSPLEAMRAALPEMQAREARPIAKGALGSPVEPMTPAETKAYMAEHPNFAVQVERHARELAERYGAPTAGVGSNGLDLDRSTAQSPSFPEPLGRSGDPGGMEAAETVADEQRASAAQSLTTRDNPATPQDERADGVAGGADHLEYADASSARAAGIASQSFPKPVAPATTRTPPATVTRSATAVAVQGRRR